MTLVKPLFHLCPLPFALGLLQRNPILNRAPEGLKLRQVFIFAADTIGNKFIRYRVRPAVRFDGDELLHLLPPPNSPNQRRSPRYPARPCIGIVDKAIASEVGQTAGDHIAVKVDVLRQLKRSHVGVVKHGVVDSGLLRGALAAYREFLGAQVRGVRVGGAGDSGAVGEVKGLLR